MDFRNPEIQRYVLAWSRKTLTIEKGLRVCVYTNLKTSQNLWAYELEVQSRRT